MSPSTTLKPENLLLVQNNDLEVSNFGSMLRWTRFDKVRLCSSFCIVGTDEKEMEMKERYKKDSKMRCVHYHLNLALNEKEIGDVFFGKDREVPTS